MSEPCSVLFLCTGNSARSILGEAILHRLGGGRFRAESAGSKPMGSVHPQALELLHARGYETGRFRSKSWDEFADSEAARFDLIFTVCDNAAAEACPVWPGHPLTLHWGLPDPAAQPAGEIQRRAFEATYQELERRIGVLVQLDPRTLDPASLRAQLSFPSGA